MSEFMLNIIKGERKVFPLSFENNDGIGLDFTGVKFAFAIDLIGSAGEILQTIERNSVIVSQDEVGKIELILEPELTSSLTLGAHNLRIKSTINSHHGDMSTMTNDKVNVISG
jgi:hypothetical protein